MHERFLVHLQLCFVVSFVLRVPGLEEGVISSGKAWGWTTGTLIWMPGKRTLNLPPPLTLLLLLFSDFVYPLRPQKWRACWWPPLA